MKNIFAIFIMAILTIVLSNSCRKIPEASFTASKTSAVVGETINFTNTSDNGSSYKWEFGDGNTSTEASPSYVFNTVGTYTVELTAFSKKRKEKRC